MIRSHNLAISELSGGVSKEGIQRRLTVNRDNHEEVSRLVVPDVNVDGRVSCAVQVGGGAPARLASAVGDVGEVAGVDATGLVVGDLELVVTGVGGVVAGANETLEGPGAVGAGGSDGRGGSGESGTSEGEDGGVVHFEGGGFGGCLGTSVFGWYESESVCERLMLEMRL